MWACALPSCSSDGQHWTQSAKHTADTEEKHSCFLILEREKSLSIKELLSFADELCSLWVLLQKLNGSMELLWVGCTCILTYGSRLWLSTWESPIGCFLPSAMFFLNKNYSIPICSLSVSCSMLLDFWANAGFPTLLQSIFTMSLKHFFCPYSVRMPIFRCPLGNCFDNLLSAILFIQPTYWNWITISMTFLLVYWQCSGPSLMQIILPFNLNIAYRENCLGTGYHINDRPDHGSKK